VEPLVQGAGGMKFHDAETLAAIARIAERHGCLLILDEIMTGFGRTGTMFACEQAGIIPDIICLSKALTGGTIALAATVARHSVFDAFWSDDPAAALMHGPTFMANPLACAAANASLDLFASADRLGQARAIETALAEELAPCRDLPGILDVRVKGAIGVIQLQELGDAAWLRRRFLELGVWARPFADILYVMPPLVIERDDLATLGMALRTVAGEWSARALKARGKSRTPTKPPAPSEAC
jgi:adenosylmethionine-8-amino-7-oxononanoate aminotransferase